MPFILHFFKLFVVLLYFFKAENFLHYVGFATCYISSIIFLQNLFRTSTHERHYFLVDWLYEGSSVLLICLFVFTALVFVSFLMWEFGMYQEAVCSFLCLSFWLEFTFCMFYYILILYRWTSLLASHHLICITCILKAINYSNVSHSYFIFIPFDYCFCSTFILYLED